MGDLIANGLWFAVAWYAARDVLLIGERIYQWLDEYRKRRAERRDESSRAGEVSACRGDTTWTRSGPAPTPVDAVNPRLAASAGLHGQRHG